MELIVGINLSEKEKNALVDVEHLFSQLSDLETTTLNTILCDGDIDFDVNVYLSYSIELMDRILDHLI